MDQMAQLMDHHIVSNGMRCLDDVPVEEQLTSGIARPPAGLEVANTDPRGRHADLLRSTANAIAPEQDGKTFQDRVKDAVVEKVTEEE